MDDLLRNPFSAPPNLPVPARPQPRPSIVVGDDDDQDDDVLEPDAILYHPPAPPPNATDQLQVLRTSWLRSLRAERKSKQTLTAYGRAVNAFIEFLADPPDYELEGVDETAAELLERMPVLDESDIRRDHVEAHIGYLQDRHKPNSVVLFWSALRVWFKWMAAQPDIAVDRNPMDGMKRPKIPEEPPEILSKEEIRALLKTCDPKTFIGVRDEAIIRLLADTGIRIEELCTLMNVDVLDGQRVPTVDMDTEAVYVMGKGRRARTVAFGARTALAVDRYIRARRKHPHRARPEFWLTDPRYKTYKPMQTNTVRQMLERRAQLARIKHIHPHLFRHTWADAMKRRRMDRGDLKNQGGWRSDKSVDRYGAIFETDRALLAHRRHSFGDEI